VDQHCVEVCGERVQRGADGGGAGGAAVDDVNGTAEREGGAQDPEGGISCRDSNTDVGGDAGGIHAAEGVGQEHLARQGDLRLRHAVAQTLAGTAGHQDDAHTLRAGNGF